MVLALHRVLRPAPCGCAGVCYRRRVCCCLVADVSPLYGMPTASSLMCGICCCWICPSLPWWDVQISGFVPVGCFRAPFAEGIVDPTVCRGIPPDFVRGFVSLVLPQDQMGAACGPPWGFPVGGDARGRHLLSRVTQEVRG